MNTLILLVVLLKNTIYTSDDKWIHSEHVNNFIQQAMKCYNLNGFGISVAENDKIIYQQTFGYSNVGLKTLYSKSKTKILIASISKSFAAILLNSKIKSADIQSDLNSILPKNNKVEFMTPCRTKISSLEDLLAHRMAVTRHDFTFVFDGMRSDQLLERMKYIPPMPDNLFRAKFVYNNIMYAVAEKISEILLNSSFSDLMNKTIFSPLNLTETVMMSKSMDISQLAKSIIVDEIVSDKILLTASNNLAACGIVTTIKDMGKWQLFLTHNRYSEQLKNLNRALFKTISAKIALDLENMPILQLGLNESIKKSLNIRTVHHYNYGMGWLLSNYRDQQLVWHGGTYFGIESILMWVPNLNISVFINFNARIDSTSKKYQQIIQQIPLIMIDLLLDNKTRISSDNICDLFGQIDKPKSLNNSSVDNYEMGYNLNEDILPIIYGKYNHLAFGDISIRNYTSKDKEWISNTFNNSATVLEYGNLFKTLLFQTKQPCERKQYFLRDADKKQDNTFEYYGFFMYEGQPFWFLKQSIVQVMDKIYVLNNNICQVIIQHNLINNERKLQIRLLDKEINEFVLKGCRINSSVILLVDIIVVSILVFNRLL